MKDLKEQKSIRRFNKNADATLQVIEERQVLNKEFRIYGTPEEPLFLAKDVADWIDYPYESKTRGIRKVSQMVNMVDDEEKVKRSYNVATTSDSNNVATTSRKTQQTWFLTEDGLYEVLMQSRKPIAKQFKKEVKTILKQIRQTGGYIPLSEEDTEQEILSKALSIMKNTLDKKDKLLKQQQKVIEEQKPLAEFGQALAKSDTSILIREMAKIITQSTSISMGEKKFYSWLRENKYIMQGSTEPYQKRVEQGLFERKANGTFTRSDGTTHTSYTTYVTPKGQQHFIDKFMRLEK